MGRCAQKCRKPRFGCGWDVDGLEGEVQAASTGQGGFSGYEGHASPLKTPQGSFVGQDKTIGIVNEAVMRDVAITGVMGNPAAPVKTPQDSRAGKDETIGDGFSPIENCCFSAAYTSPNLMALLQVDLFWKSFIAYLSHIPFFFAFPTIRALKPGITSPR